MCECPHTTSVEEWCVNEIKLDLHFPICISQTCVWMKNVYNWCFETWTSHQLWPPSFSQSWVWNGVWFLRTLQQSKQSEPSHNEAISSIGLCSDEQRYNFRYNFELHCIDRRALQSCGAVAVSWWDSNFMWSEIRPRLSAPPVLLAMPPPPAWLRRAPQHFGRHFPLVHGSSSSC